DRGGVVQRLREPREARRAAVARTIRGQDLVVLLEGGLLPVEGIDAVAPAGVQEDEGRSVAVAAVVQAQGREARGERRARDFQKGHAAGLEYSRKSERTVGDASEDDPRQAPRPTRVAAPRSRGARRSRAAPARERAGGALHDRPRGRRRAGPPGR